MSHNKLSIKRTAIKPLAIRGSPSPFSSSPSPSPDDFSKSSTKRMYESVFKIIDFDDDKFLNDNSHQAVAGLEKRDSSTGSLAHNTKTNGQKLEQLLKDETVLEHLYIKMQDQGVLDRYPILKVRCCIVSSNRPHSQSNHQHQPQSLPQYLQLEYSDILSTFNRFSGLNKIILSQDYLTAFVLGNNFHSCHAAMKLLNGLQIGDINGSRDRNLNGSTSTTSPAAILSIEWMKDNADFQYLMMFSHMPEYISQQIDWSLVYIYTTAARSSSQSSSSTSNLGSTSECTGSNSNTTHSLNRQQSSSSSSNNLNPKQCKLTCRYDVQIDNQRDFQVARRIIGSKGCNMKRIIEDSIELARQQAQANGNLSNLNSKKFYQNGNQLLKLRLRGKGSGYKEGPDQRQSDQVLHLCVSAKDEACYQFACEKVEKLIKDVYNQYAEYLKRQGKKIINLSICKSSVSASGLVSSSTGITNTGGIGEEIILSSPSVASASFNTTNINNANDQHKSQHQLLQLKQHQSTTATKNILPNKGYDENSINSENTSCNRTHLNFLSDDVKQQSSLSNFNNGSVTDHNKNLASSSSVLNLNQNVSNNRMTPQQIYQLLEMRNKARRELNFVEADRIRNYLRNCGVCLIDEKGRRGKAAQVTTWKYIF